MLEDLNGKQMRGIPTRRRDFYNSVRRRMTDQHYQAAIDAINQYIDSHNEVFISSFIPGSDWTDTPFAPIYVASGQNWDHSRFFFGLMVWDAVANHRPGERWKFLLSDKDADDVLGTRYWRADVQQGGG